MSGAPTGRYPSRFEPTGANLIAATESATGSATYTGVDPATGQPTGPAFVEATSAEVDRAVAAAVGAAPTLAGWPATGRATLLRAVAESLEAVAEQLLPAAATETGLAAPRLTGELGRTTTQLRAFADLLDEGSYVQAIIDTPRVHAVLGALPDLRRMLVPLGPVAVFGASNFPLAFGVAGGDTASALAAGCPVLVKAHPSHPLTSELVARAVLAAGDAVGAPAGFFSLLHGRSPEMAQALVRAPGVRAVGFTGSYVAGRALFDAAAGRPDPIPVFAEMGSVNPTFVTAAAARTRGDDVAEGYVASMTMGNGQFCTKPGLLFVPADEAGEALLRRIANLVAHAPGGTLLNRNVAAGLAARLATTRALAGVEVLAEGRPADAGISAAPVLLGSDVDTFVATPDLQAEHFGPAAVAIRTPADRYLDAAGVLEGSLTATIHCEPDDWDTIAPLVDVLRERAGRIVFNGYPTGVAVVAAMHHGGPHPATTAPAHTSVGTTAINRFLRPVAYQNTPPPLLPAALRDENPLRIRRLVDGVWSP